MKIEIQPLVVPREFSEVRELLIGEGKVFDKESLRLIPYSQLNLCCIGNAGVTACSPLLVKQEKVSRRERFLSMDAEEFKRVTTYLKIEQMYTDVMYDLSNRVAKKTSDLSNGQMLWARLTCLYNHIDNPSPRIDKALEAFNTCAKDPTCYLPVDVCGQYASKLRGLATVYPGRITDETFRDKLHEMANTLLDFMPENERKIVEKEQFHEFSCTSDCFRVML